jgi:hypothetical protein
LLGLVIELHNIDLHSKLLHSFLKKNKYLKIVHIHSNNMGGISCSKDPLVIELTLLNINLSKNYKAVKKNIPFIHSYMFGVTRSGFSVVKNVFAQITTDDKTYAVHNTERKLTSAVLVNGHKVSSLLSRFKNVDLNDQTNWDYKLWKGPKNATCYEVPGNYFGIDLNPYEIIFVKNIRNANETRSQFSSGISDKLFLEIQNYSKWL